MREVVRVTVQGSIYNLSSCMTYVSFITLCLKLYSLPSDWTYGMTLLRHTLGLVSVVFA